MIRDLFELTGIFVAIIVITVMGITGIVYIVGPRQCESTAHIMKTKHHWELLSGCFVEVDGKMEPLSWQGSVREVRR